ncbi:phage tail tape measure protein [Micromonospora sp. NPDC004704]
MGLKLGELDVILKARRDQFRKDLADARQDFAQHGDMLTGAAGALGIAAAGAIAVGLSGAMDLSAARAKLEAQVGDPALAAKLGEVAGAVYGRGFGDSVGEAFEAVRAVTSSGLVPDGDVGKIEDLTVKAQAYAKAWDTDVAQATQYASTLIGSGLVDNATEAFDLITVASRKVPAAMREDVLEAGNEYGQFFNSLGFNGSQAFALLTEASQKGTYGIDKAGDALKEFTIRSTDMSTASVDAYKAIGLDAGKMSNQLLKGGDTAQAAFQKIVSGLLSIKDPTKRANTAIALFGTPLEDLNVNDIPDFLRNLKAAGDGLGDVSGEAAKTGEALEKSASQKFEVFKRQIQSALVEKVGEALPMLERMGKWAMENSDKIMVVAGVLGGLAVTIWLVQGAIAAWNAITMIWSGITVAATAVQWAWNAALAANPIGVVIIAIIALVAAFIWLWNNSSTFRDFWIGTWEVIKTAAVWTWENGLKPAFDAIWAALKAVGAAGVWLWQEALVPAWNGTVAAAKWLWDALVATFNGIKAAFTWVGDAAGATKDWIVGRWDSLVGFFRSMPGKIRSAATGMWDGLVSSFRGAVNTIISKWNGFSLTLGGGSVLGMGIPSVTLNTPNVPYLAKGGDILRAGAAVVGEAGPELLHLPVGARVQPLPKQGGSGHAEAKELRLAGEFRIRGEDLVLVIRERVDIDGGGNVDYLSGRRT